MIVVIGILAAISIVAYNGIQARANTTAVKADIASNSKKLEEYKILNGKYPESREEFLSANLKFSKGSTRYAVCCVNNSGSGPGSALVMRPMGADVNVYKNSEGGVIEGAVSWYSSATACGSAGLAGDDLDGRWLRGNGDWSDWVG